MFIDRHACPAVLQVWQQQFAWTEAGEEVKLAARAITLPESDKLAQEPLLCFETMLHLLYWSCLVYDYKRVCQDTVTHTCSSKRLY